MLRSCYAMLDYHIVATDGVQGTVQDFLFDDETWTVHYLVVETATPLGKRKVLILPFVMGRPDWEMKRLPLLLTCEQIRSRPPLEADLPISQQRQTGLKEPGSHLRSMQELLGYSVYTTDGEVGTIEDFVMEDTLWGVHHIIISLKQPRPRSIVMPPESMRSISWPGKAAWVNLSLKELAAHLEFDPGAPVNRDRVHGITDYYGRPINPPALSTSEARAEIQQH
jgi:sporulation protein YlmC with PRC-barrel domain